MVGTTESSGGLGRSSPDIVGSGSASGSDSHRSRSTSAATDANSLAALDPDNAQKPSEAAFAKARATRPEICGSYAPERPYPIYLRGLVERGFGRGGKDLGCPTANLPSKIFKTQTHLQRTGIYYGWARVLPQDPDDPDLMTEGEEEGGEDVPQGSAAPAQPIEDEVTSDYDEDGDEVILSASPIHEPEESMEAQKWREGAAGSDLQYLLKPRQLSRSSARSSRSVATILEKAGVQLDLDRTASSQGVQSTSLAGGLVSNESTASAPGDAKESSAKSQALAPAPQIVPKATSGISEQLQTADTADADASSAAASSIDKHARDQSGSSSKNSSLRRKKKRRVPIAFQDARVYPMVMSVGWNPFYNNTAKTAEVHIMHKFASDFYGLEMRVVVLGYIRPEYNYVSKEALIADIDMDKRVAENSLARSPYQDYKADPFLMAPS